MDFIYYTYAVAAAATVSWMCVSVGNWLFHLRPVTVYDGQSIEVKVNGWTDTQLMKQVNSIREPTRDAQLERESERVRALMMYASNIHSHTAI